MLSTESAATPLRTDFFPPGQVTSTSSAARRGPKPKWSLGSSLERKLDPRSRTRVITRSPARTVTTAPAGSSGIPASGLYVVTAITRDGPGAKVRLLHLLRGIRFGEARIGDLVRAGTTV